MGEPFSLRQWANGAESSEKILVTGSRCQRWAATQIVHLAHVTIEKCSLFPREKLCRFRLRDAPLMLDQTCVTRSGGASHALAETKIMLCG
jgi:hypothetical protein